MQSYLSAGISLHVAFWCCIEVWRYDFVESPSDVIIAVLALLDVRKPILVPALTLV